MARFPTLQALAAAPIDEVLHLWTGLGYYARARNLHRAAQMHRSQSTAAISRHARCRTGVAWHRSLDCRRDSCVVTIATTSDSRRQRQARARRATSASKDFRGAESRARAVAARGSLHAADRVANYTQAIMDLGATVCVRSRPLCAACPLSEGCLRASEGRQAILPTPRPRKARPQRVAYAVDCHEPCGAVLLERRPPAGLWGGLWTFPQFDDHQSASAWTEKCGVALKSMSRHWYIRRALSSNSQSVVSCRPITMPSRISI